MTVEVKVPVLAESIPDATLLEWKRQPGDRVEQDEILIELETDKVVLEVPAPQAGVLAEVLKQTGDTVLSQEVLARIEPGETTRTAESSAVVPSAGVAAVPEVEAPATAADPGRLSPAVRRLVDEHGLDPSVISGTGRDGRLTKADVLAHLEATAKAETDDVPLPSPTASVPESDSGLAGSVAALPEPAPPQPASRSAAFQTEQPEPGHRSERRKPMSRLRRRIAERLVEAQHAAAILTTFNEIDMQAVIALRTRHKESFEHRHGVRLGFMSFFARAAVQALRRFPAVNARIDDGDIVYHDYCDIGVAVGSPRGLVVPILRSVEEMSFAEIESRIAEFGTRARDDTLTIDDMSGGTFTISNGGVFGSLLSTPILNPPQSGILGMHKTEERPVVVNGEVVVRPMMYVALSYDHRIIDGREAVQFLVCVKEAIEDPARLLLDV